MINFFNNLILRAYAQNPIPNQTNSLGDLEQIDVPSNTKYKDIFELVANLLGYFLLFCGILAFIALIYGGFQYIMSGGDPSVAERGKKSVMYSIIGIIVIILAITILNFVKSNIG